MIIRCPSCAAQIDEAAVSCPACHWDFEARRTAAPGRPSPPSAPGQTPDPPNTEIRSSKPPPAPPAASKPDPGPHPAERFRKNRADLGVSPAQGRPQPPGQPRSRWALAAQVLAVTAAIALISLVTIYLSTRPEEPETGPPPSRALFSKPAAQEPAP